MYFIDINSFIRDIPPPPLKGDAEMAKAMKSEAQPHM